MNNLPIRGNDFLDSFKLFVFSDPNGLWINHKNGDRKLIYQLPSSWEIELITIDEVSNSIYFTEVYRSDQWVYSNVRTNSIDRTFIIETIASTAGRRSPGSFSMFGKHYPSLNGNYLVLERGSWEGASFDLYKKIDQDWIRQKVPTESDYQRVLGWSGDSKKLYFSRANPGVRKMEGMFSLNTESFEVQQVNELNVRTMDPERNMFLTIPYVFRFNRPYTLEFREIESGNLMKSVDYQFRGLPLWGQIQWHSSLPIVLIPERSTDGRKPHTTFIGTISPVDSLNFSLVLPGWITQFQWMNDGYSFLYVFEGDLCQYSFKSEEFVKIVIPANSKDIQTFAVKWIE
jgi:hypothetical protein